MAMPRTSMRVVCTLCETIETLEPTSALIRVDLPALGAPISATKPQRVSPDRALRLSHRRRHAFALQQGGGGGLFGRALRAALAFGRRRDRATSTATRNSGASDAGRCARPRDRTASAGRAPAPIPAARSSDRAAAAPACASARPRTARPAPSPRHSRRRERPRRSGTRRHPQRIAMRDRPPALISEAPSRSAAPRSIARATSAQVSRRTRSASRRDNSPSSALGKAANSISEIASPSTWSPRNSSR